jgi:hypothetical protein
MISLLLTPIQKQLEPWLIQLVIIHLFYYLRVMIMKKQKVGSVIEEQKKATAFNWYLWEGLGTIISLYFLIMEFIVFWTAIKDWKIGIVNFTNYYFNTKLFDSFN